MKPNNALQREELAPTFALIKKIIFRDFNTVDPGVDR